MVMSQKVNSVPQQMPEQIHYHLVLFSIKQNRVWMPFLFNHPFKKSSFNGGVWCKDGVRKVLLGVRMVLLGVSKVLLGVRKGVARC